MRVFITASPREEAAAEKGRTARQIVLDSLRASAPADIEVVEGPEGADLVFFVEPAGDESDRDDALSQIVRLGVYREHRERAVVYSAKDLPRPLVPGLYPSISRRWAGWLGSRGAPYLTELNPFLTRDVGWDGRTERLASFRGVCKKVPLRLRLMEACERGGWPGIEVKDTSREFLATLRAGDMAAHNALKEQFVRDVLECKFALCPRGNGPSSFRIFEAMQLGRAPVIMADEWAEPAGPDWDSFAVRVPESRVGTLDRVLRELEPEWARRGALARAAWEEYYAAERVGATMVKQAWEVMSACRGRHAALGAVSRVYEAVPRRVALIRRELGRRLAARRDRGGTPSPA